MRLFPTLEWLPEHAKAWSKAGDSGGKASVLEPRFRGYPFMRVVSNSPQRKNKPSYRELVIRRKECCFPWWMQL